MDVKYTKWFSNLLPAFTSSIIITITCTAAASLIFSGPLSDYIPLGISCALIGAVIVNFINGFYCVFPFAVSSITPNASVIIAIFLDHIAEGQMTQTEEFYTILGAFIGTNLIVALVIFLWGKLKLARIIRYMPFPVLSGFYAGVGGYLILGAFVVLTGQSLTMHIFSQPHLLMLALPMFVFIVVVYAVQVVQNSPRSFFIIVIFSVLVFYSYLYFNGINLEDAGANGYLLSDFKLEFVFPKILPLSNIQHVQFGEIIKYWIFIPIIVLVNLLSLLVYAVNFEDMSKEDVDVNKECQYIGAANIVGGLFTGATTIYTTQSLVHKATGANHRISITYVAVFCLFILLYSKNIIPYIPKFIISGILLLNGIRLIEKWLFKVWRKVHLAEWIIISIIFLVMMFRGFLEGVTAGIILACLLFILNYSRQSIIRYSITGKDHISNSAYSLKVIEKLENIGHRIQIIKLQGYVFFGSAEKLLVFIKEVFVKEPEIKYLIIDMSLVDDVDSTAIASLVKILRFVKSNKAKLILTSVSPNVYNHLGLTMQAYRHNLNANIKFTKLASHKGSIYIFKDLDYGLQWCEHQFLLKMEHDFDNYQVMLDEFSEFLPTAESIKTFTQYLTLVEFEKDTIITKKGDTADSMYFIVEGHVAIYIGDEKHQKRLREFGPGSIVAEQSIFSRDKVRRANVICMDDTKAYQLKLTDLERMSDAHPELAFALLNWVLCIMSERLHHTNNEITVLTK